MNPGIRSIRFPASGWALSLVLALSACPSAPLAQTADENAALKPHAISLDEIRAGDLLWRSEDGLIPLPMLDTDVDIEVNGVMIHGSVTQTFQNPTDDVIEAIYVFPLPENAAVNHMELRIGDRRIVSQIKEKREAKRVYDTAKREGKKAALLDQERPNLFTSSVANINPGESIEVELSYVEEAFYRDGEFSLVFPLTFTPRFIPGASVQVNEATGAPEVTSSRVSDADRLTPPFMEASEAGAPSASFTVRIDAGLPLAEVTCPSHSVRISKADGIWRVEPTRPDVLADRDVKVQWRPELGHAPTAVVLTEAGVDGRYGMLMIAPPAPPADPAAAGIATETMFVLDVSGSMAGPSIEQAREALLAALTRMRPLDRFNIVTFNDESRLFADTFVPADDESLKRARRFVRGLEANGGTQIYPALLRSLSMFDAPLDGDTTASRIIFLTDGAVGNEADVLQRLLAGLGSVRLHTIGIGHAPNRYLMRKMAEAGRGHVAFISETNAAENEIDRFFTRLSRPVLTDIEIEWTGPKPESVYPTRLPDLHAGDPLVASFHLPEGGAGEVTVRGRSRAGEFHTIVAMADEPTSDSGIAHRWARAKVASLMTDLDGGADPAVIRRDVIDVGLAHSLVTKYTSLVAVDVTPTAVGPAQSMKVANALPHGSQLLGGGLPQGGTSGPMRRAFAWVLIFSAGLLAVAGRVLGGAHAQHRR